VPFSRLTFTAQLEVLARLPEGLWRACLPRNLFPPGWRTRPAAHSRRPLGRAPLPGQVARL